MKCKDYDIEKINRYIDGEMDENEKNILEEHIGKCTYCRGYLEALKTSVSFMKESSIETVSAPDRVWSRVMEKITERGRRKIKWGYIFAPAAALAVLTFVIFSRNSSAKLLDDYILTQLSYLDEAQLVDNWYLEEENEADIFDLVASENL